MSFNMNMGRMRRFLKKHKYPTWLHLTRDACNGGPSEEFFNWALELRFHSRSRYTLSDVRQSLLPSRKPRWWTPACREIFNLWRLMRLRCVPQRQVHAFDSVTIGRTTRRILSRSGVVRSRPPDMQVAAQEVGTELWQSIQGRQVCMWIDNWYRKQYTTDPLKQNKSLNLAMSALLHTNELGVYQGHRTNAELLGCIPTIVDIMTRCVVDLRSRIHQLNVADIPRVFVRVPLDVVRLNARSLQWKPFIAAPHPPGTHKELLHVLDGARHVQRHTLHSMPLCVDMKIHMSISKMLFSKSYQRWDMHTWLQSLPLAYGVWHPYKHCVTLVYRQFLSILLQIERPDLKIGDRVPCKYKVQHMERTIATLLLCRKELTRRAAVRLNCLRGEASPHSPAVAQGIELLRAFSTLLDEYVPTLYSLGYLVRNCHWEGRDPKGGQTAFDILAGCLFVMLALVHPHAGKVEYVRSLCQALCTFQDWHEDACGAIFGEEMCEALLARMSFRCHQYPSFTGLEKTNWLYLTIPPTSTEPHTLKNPITEASLNQYLANGKSFIRRAGTNDSPVILYTTDPKGAHCLNPATYVENLSFPKGPVTFDLNVGQLTDIFVHSVKTLFNKSVVNPDMEAFLNANVPPRSGRGHAVDPDTRAQLRSLLRLQDTRNAGRRNPVGPIEVPEDVHIDISDEELEDVPDQSHLVPAHLQEVEEREEVDVDDPDWDHGDLSDASDFDIAEELDVDDD